MFIIQEQRKNDMVTKNKTPSNFKHVWVAGTCLIVGDSMLSGADQKQPSENNQVVKSWRF